MNPIGKPKRGTLARRTLYAGVALAVLAAWGIFSRIHAMDDLRDGTNNAAVPVVAVTTIRPETGGEDVVLPGTVKAALETPIYARTSGYLKSWKADIGAHVKAGDILAEIESPEVDQQLRQAEADLKTAQANAGLAVSTSNREQKLLAAQAVSPMEAEQRSAAAAAATATVASNQANVARLIQMTVFEKVTAPYAGIVTARETDVGALINAGSSTNAELFRMADTSRLRIYVQVPQSYARELAPGLVANLRFPEYPGRDFPATVVRSSDALDPAARTLLVELEEDNAKGELYPGSFAEVHFKLPVAKDAIRIPANALIFQGAGLRVAILGKNGHVILRPVREGRDYGAKVEITDGLTAGERLILNPPASLDNGDPVRTAGAREKPAPGSG